MIEWTRWETEVKRLSGIKKLDYPVLRNLFDLYCNGCSPREAASSLNLHILLERESSHAAHLQG